MNFFTETFNYFFVKNKLIGLVVLVIFILLIYVFNQLV